MKLRRCRECNVAVHDRCYGITPIHGGCPTFVCHPCRAVSCGLEVTVSAETGSSQDTLKEVLRPRKCALCSYDSGLHAMHPLLLPERRHRNKWRSRWAWAHTLCASFVCSYEGTAGCVYGCFSDGSFEDCCDTNSDASDDPIDSNLCYFSVASTEKGKETAWTRAIMEHCCHLRCYICGRTNKECRIPVQCSASDEEVLARVNKFSITFQEPRGCFMAMHVGEYC